MLASTFSRKPAADALILYLVNATIGEVQVPHGLRDEKGFILRKARMGQLVRLLALRDDVGITVSLSLISFQ
jgi:hypothetical protein